MRPPRAAQVHQQAPTAFTWRLSCRGRGHESPRQPGLVALRPSHPHSQPEHQEHGTPVRMGRQVGPGHMDSGDRGSKLRLPAQGRSNPVPAYRRVRGCLQLDGASSALNAGTRGPQATVSCEWPAVAEAEPLTPHGWRCKSPVTSARLAGMRGMTHGRHACFNPAAAIAARPLPMRIHLNMGGQCQMQLLPHTCCTVYDPERAFPQDS